MLNHLTTVRMTASRAAELFRTAQPITAAELSERHLDMLQLSDTDIWLRCLLGDASDCLRCGNRTASAVRACVEAYNARCGRQS